MTAEPIVLAATSPTLTRRPAATAPLPDHNDGRPDHPLTGRRVSRVDLDGDTWQGILIRNPATGRYWLSGPDVVDAAQYLVPVSGRVQPLTPKQPELFDDLNPWDLTVPEIDAALIEVQCRAGELWQTGARPVGLGDAAHELRTLIERARALAEVRDSPERATEAAQVDEDARAQPGNGQLALFGRGARRAAMRTS